jgi:predicted phage terminase large subunit-like protein
VIPAELTPRLNRYIPHYPHPPQAAFLLMNHVREVFYGGAAGGGKSDALLMGALQFVDVPTYSALLLRNTFSDLSLPGAIMERSKLWLSDTDARWVDKEHCWVFPSGAKLVFGYIEHESDKYRYKSAEFNYIGFDELTHFTQTQYTFMFSRLRRLEGSQVPARMRSASNPGGPGHDWVRQRFLIEGLSKGRLFIPAKLEDNPSLDQEDYDASLAELDPVTRAQMRAGNWDAKPKGKKFDRTTMPIVDIAPSALKTVRFWDLASTSEDQDQFADRTVGMKVGWNYVGDKKFYILDVIKGRLPPDKVETLVKQVALLDGKGTPIRIAQDPGQAGVSQIHHYATSVLPGYNMLGIKQGGDKDVRSDAIAAAAAMGNIQVLRGTWVTDLYDELEEFPFGKHDDQVDCLAGAHAFLTNLSAQVRVIHAPRRRA